MLTNVATALFGLADLWVIGQLGDANAQAGVEIGAKFMMGLLVVFNFLRTGTIALTAQAAGRGDAETQAATLVRAAGLALLIGAILLALDAAGDTGRARSAPRPRRRRGRGPDLCRHPLLGRRACGCSTRSLSAG